MLRKRIDWAKVEYTTEEGIARHAADDDAVARRAAAAYVRRVRGKLNLTQRAFARKIGVPVDTLRNREQGKRSLQEPARALLRIIDRAPEAALHALDGEWGEIYSPRWALTLAISSSAVLNHPK